MFVLSQNSPALPKLRLWICRSLGVRVRLFLVKLIEASEQNMSQIFKQARKKHPKYGALVIEMHLLHCFLTSRILSSSTEATFP